MPLTTAFPSMDPPCLLSRKRTAAERRAQRQLAEARCLQRALTGLNDVHSHRGGVHYLGMLYVRLSHGSSDADVASSSPLLCGATPFYKVCHMPKDPSVPESVPARLDAVAAHSHGVSADGSLFASAHSFDLAPLDTGDQYFNGGLASSEYHGLFGYDCEPEPTSPSQHLVASRNSPGSLSWPYTLVRP